MSNPGNPHLLVEHLQSEFQRQMESWLDYVWEHHRDERFARRQGIRFVGPRKAKQMFGGGHLAKTESYHKRGPSGKKSARAAFNNHALYNEWTEMFREEGFPEEWTNIGKRVYVQYDEAVVEMHIFLDWMDDNLPRNARQIEEENMTWDELLGEEE
ncbi:MAG: hypothetical protein CL489_06735 [Acidobacteria bacterium]|nr:hypothetical protein [Acidobacteriota bacterium]